MKKSVIICAAIGVVLIIGCILLINNQQTTGGLLHNSGAQATDGQNAVSEVNADNQIRENNKGNEDVTENPDLYQDNQNDLNNQVSSDGNIIYKEEVLVEPSEETDLGVGISVESDNSTVESIFGVSGTESSGRSGNNQTSGSKSGNDNKKTKDDNDSKDSETETVPESSSEIESDDSSETEPETPKDTYLFDSTVADKTIDFEFFINRMSPTTKQALYDAAPTPQAYLDWVAGLREKYEEENAGNVSPAESPMKFPD